MHFQEDMIFCALLLVGAIQTEAKAMRVVCERQIFIAIVSDELEQAIDSVQIIDSVIWLYSCGMCEVLCQ